MTYSRMANATLPSAMRRFTSEFEMGSGGSNALLSSSKLVELALCSFASAVARSYCAKQPLLILDRRVVS
jgi:hypothetical protein